MLTPVKQMDSPSPQIPWAWGNESVADWLRAEADPTGTSFPESSTPDALSRISLDFVRRLAADARLRAALAADPATTLACHGIYVDPEKIPAVVSLPGPDALEGVLRIHATGEDAAARLKFGGFLGGFLDGFLEDD